MSTNCKKLNNDLSQNASSLAEDFKGLVRSRGVFLNLVNASPLPEGKGFNYQEIVPLYGTSDTKVFDFSVCQAQIRSEKICLEDARSGYRFEQAVRNAQLNLMDNVLESVEVRVMDEYARFCPQIQSEDLFKTLDELYPNLVMDGAFDSNMVRESGEPVFLCVTSLEMIQKAQEHPEKLFFGNGKLGSDWLAERVARVDASANADVLLLHGFVFICSEHLPRYTGGGEFVPKWTEKETLGKGAVEFSDEYLSAQLQLSVVWNDKAVDLLLPKDTKEGFGVKWEWKNILNADVDHPDFNPLGNVGWFYSQMMNAVRPGIIQFGATIKHPR